MAKGEETASEIPFGVWKAPGFLRRGPWEPHQFFLVLGVSYFLLLEYQSSRGMPMEGRVMTPKAAQSRKWGRISYQTPAEPGCLPVQVHW